MEKFSEKRICVCTILVNLSSGMTAHQSAYGKLPGLIVIFLPLRRMAQLIGILAGCALAQNAVRSGVQPNSTPGLEL